MKVYAGRKTMRRSDGMMRWTRLCDPPSEPARWTVVFHHARPKTGYSPRWRWAASSMSRRFAWLPDTRVWLHYDLGFRRTRIIVLPDTAASVKAYLATPDHRQRHRHHAGETAMHGRMFLLHGSGCSAPRRSST